MIVLLPDPIIYVKNIRQTDLRHRKLQVQERATDTEKEAQMTFFCVPGRINHA